MYFSCALKTLMIQPVSESTVASEIWRCHGYHSGPRALPHPFNTSPRKMLLVFLWFCSWLRERVNVEVACPPSQPLSYRQVFSLLCPSMLWSWEEINENRFGVRLTLITSGETGSDTTAWQTSSPTPAGSSSSFPKDHLFSPKSLASFFCFPYKMLFNPEF